MKALFEHLERNAGRAVLWRSFTLPSFDHGYHFHPELELTLIRSGTGKRYTGHHVGEFSSGDLVLLGSDLPHCWQSDPQKGEASAVVVQFSTGFCGRDFLQTEEGEVMSDLFRLAGAGLRLEGRLRNDAENVLLKMEHMSAFERWHTLAGLLHDIRKTGEFRALDPRFMAGRKTFSETLRFQKVYNYLIENYAGTVSLEQAASEASLSPTAFCRYFKQVTGRTFMEMVTDFRMNHAARLLRTTGKQVGEICTESGFSDLPHFIRTFRKVHRCSPSEFRKRSA